MAEPVTIDNWNFRERRLLHDIGRTGGEFVTSESVLILASPQATLRATGEDETVDPTEGARVVALTQDIGIQQQPQIMQIHEVGSNRKYTLRSGRVQQGMNLSRALFHSENLLRAFSRDYDPADFVDRDRPGYGDFVMNMSSSVFSRPVGLIFVFRDLQDDNIGGFFCEETFVQSHSMQTSANSPMVMENVQLVWNALIPLQMTVN